MAIEPQHKITEQEVYDNYEFKVIKRALMREYPWVTDVTVSQEDLDEYRLIFLAIDIDLPKLIEATGWIPSSWVTKAWNDGKYYSGNHIATFIERPSYEGTNPLMVEMNKLIESIHNSPALPNDLKIMPGRAFSVGSYHFHRGGEPW